MTFEEKPCWKSSVVYKLQPFHSATRSFNAGYGAEIRCIFCLSWRSYVKILIKPSFLTVQNEGLLNDDDDGSMIRRYVNPLDVLLLFRPSVLRVRCSIHQGLKFYPSKL